MSKKEYNINVNGLAIKSDAIYKVTGKPDSTAPSGFIQEGVTKLPSLGIGNSVPIRYVITNKARKQGVYDTGLYAESPCYANMDMKLVKSTVQLLDEVLVTPYERKYGQGILNHRNEDFWIDFNANLFEGRFFNTDKVDDLLELYVAMMGYELTPKESLGNPKYREAQYCIEDKDKVRSKKDQLANKVMNTITRFGSLYDTDRSKLLLILKYVKLLGVHSDIKEDTLKSVFYEWINKSEKNLDRFEKAWDKANGDGVDELDIYQILHKLAVKKVLTKESGLYTYKGNELGADLKTCAANVCNKNSLKELKIELLELDSHDE